MKGFSEKFILLISFTSTIALTFILHIFEVPNPNVVLLTALVYFTFLGGYLSGAISAIIIILYTIFRNIEPQQLFLFSEETIKRIIVTLLFIPLMVCIVGYLKKDLIDKNKELETANEYLKKISITDSLTSIYNRRYFDEVYSDEFKRAARLNIPLSLAIIDIDFFKQFNDIYGHIAGDNSLISVAQNIQSQVMRIGDFAARYGGDEFAVVLPNTGIEGGVVVCEKILKSIRSLKISHKASTNGILTLSIGIASCYDFQNCSSEDLVNLADQALYRAKEKGRNQYSS